MTIPSRTLWHTGPDVDTDPATGGVYVAPVTGAYLQASGSNDLMLGFWSNRDWSSVVLTQVEAIALLGALTGKYGTFEANYLGVAWAANEGRARTFLAEQVLEHALWMRKTDRASETLNAAVAKASQDLWVLLQVGDDEPLPPVTVRALSPGEPVGTTKLTLAHVDTDQWVYTTRDYNHPYFGPATLDGLRAMLADERYKA